MATLATITADGNTLVYSGGVGVSANDLIIQTKDMSRFDEFMLMSVGGAAQVLASLDGTVYATAPLSLQDLGSASLVTAVLLTAPLRIYRFRGKFAALQVTQNGATAVTNVILVAARRGQK